MRTRLAMAALLVLVTLPVTPAWPAPDSNERIDQLESQVEQLRAQLVEVLRILEEEKRTAQVAEAPSPAPSPPVADVEPPASGGGSLVEAIAEHLRIGGSANAGYYHGRDDSFFDPGGFLIWDARLFVDAELGEPVELFDTTVVRNAGLSFEWNLVRIGKEFNEVGELYVDLQGLGDSRWANLQVGRFQIPVGEAYLRYSKGYASKPFISNPVGGPWYWDEGVRLYGSSSGGRIGYVASIANGETPFNDLVDSDKQYSLKLYGRPADWLYLSASGLYTGELGSKSQPANGALWLGESWARAFGSGSDVPNYIDGVARGDGPFELQETWFAGVDAVVTPFDHVRLWLAYGHFGIDSKGPSRYDRGLHYWISELIVGGALVHPELRNLYLGLRANGLGTYDEDRGYLLDSRQDSTIGYNASSLTDYSIVLGWKMLKLLTLRAEYTHRDVDLVDGVNSEIRSRGEHLDYFAIELGAHF